MRARVALVAALALLAACTTHGRTSSADEPFPTAPSTAPSTVPPTPTSTAPTTPAPPVSWHACPGHLGWDCATVPVPIDFRAPDGPHIGIAVTRHRATGTRVGDLLVNPGGPGVSGVAFAYAAVARHLLDATLAGAFDIIGFDPRGVGGSAAVECVDGPTMDRILHLDPNPTTPAALTAFEAANEELAGACGARNAALLGHVSTIDAARDLEALRAALGDPVITYLGFSYGTLLGAEYAALYPSHIHAMALDSAEDPAIDAATMDLDQAVGFERNLDDFLADCSAHQTRCPFAPRGAATLRAAFNSLMARITASGLPAAAGRVLGPGEALFGVALPLYLQATWPTLAQALAAAQGGDGSALLQLADRYSGRSATGTYDNSVVANDAVNCLDRPAPPTIGAFRALAAQAAAQAPYFGAPVVWGSLACLYWPVRSATPVGPLHVIGAPPILVAGSTGDPATPYGWAQHLAAELGSGVLITRQGDGHGAYTASGCVRTLVDAYLVRGTVPSPTTCAP